MPAALLPLIVLPVLLILVGAAPAAHHGRGGRRHHRGAEGGGSAQPGKPIPIGVGYRPQVLVDERRGRPHHLGEPVGGARAGGRTHLHRRLGQLLPARAGRAQLRRPRPLRRADHLPPAAGDTSPFFENSPGLNQDIGEGSLPLATGNQLAILAHRPGNVVAVPGGTSADVNFLWTSDDGGKKFTGPGLTSTMDYYGGAVAYGNPSSIGIFGSTGELIGDDKTLGHVFFQEVRAGAVRAGGSAGRARARRKTTCWRGARSSPTATARWSPSTTSRT